MNYAVSVESVKRLRNYAELKEKPTMGVVDT
jgi:hypothetical protein